MKYIDLTHTFTKKMPVYPGDPMPELVQTAFINEAGYNEFQIKSGMHVGTHMDSPLHMIAHGKRLSEYSADRFFGEGHLIDAREKDSIDVDLLEGHKISKGDIVLIVTGFYKKFNSPDYYEKYPEITEGFALKLIELGVKIVGMDTPSPDRPPFKIHKMLLENEILIIENITNLEELLKHAQFGVVALPAKFDAEAAPVRVIAHIND
ncbi:MAG: cyclase family protein [Candidatus Gracilibacteria bacterium]